jgi:YD repeat-containing protein
VTSNSATQLVVATAWTTTPDATSQYSILAIPLPDGAQVGGDGLITTRSTHDRNSLVSDVTDDNGNRSQYTYDNLDRTTAETKVVCVPPALADRCDSPTTTTSSYNVDSVVVSSTGDVPVRRRQSAHVVQYFARRGCRGHDRAHVPVRRVVARHARQRQQRAC